MYLVRLTLIEMVKEPGVGVNEEFTLCCRSGNLGAAGAGGILCVLCHTVAEDCYQVRVVTYVGVFTSQDGHESTKQPWQLAKIHFDRLRQQGVSTCLSIMPGEESALSPRQNVATSVFYACACMHFSPCAWLLTSYSVVVLISLAIPVKSLIWRQLPPW